MLYSTVVIRRKFSEDQLYEIIASAVVTVVIVVSAFLFFAPPPPKTETTLNSARQRLGRSLIGHSIVMPKRDVNDRAIPTEIELKIAVLPYCNSCSLNNRGELRYPIDFRPDLIIVQDIENLDKYKKFKSATHLNVLFDPGRKVAPQLAYDMAPFFAKLDRDGKIKEVISWP